MDYTILGRSGLRVSQLALGCLAFGTDWGPRGLVEEDAFKVLDAFAEEGGNFLDTADVYTEGASERIVGNYIRAERDRWVLATKFSGSHGVLNGYGSYVPHPNSGGNHRSRMVRAVDQSLRRLGTDYIDVLYLHFWDFTTRPEEVMRAFDDLVSAGKVNYPAFSDTPAWVVAEANTRADLLGWAPAVAVQVEYSLLERGAERELFPLAQASDLAIVPWRALAGGLLAGDTNFLPGREISETEDKIVAEVRAVAGEVGATAAEVALAWVRSRNAWAPMVPLVGARSPEEVRAAVAALALELDESQLDRLDAVSAIDLGFPMRLLLRGQPPELATAGMRSRIANHRRVPDPDHVRRPAPGIR